MSNVRSYPSTGPSVFIDSTVHRADTRYVGYQGRRHIGANHNVPSSTYDSSHNDYKHHTSSLLTDWADLGRLAGVAIGSMFDEDDEETPKREPLPVAKVHDRTNFFRRLLDKVRGV